MSHFVSASSGLVATAVSPEDRRGIDGFFSGVADGYLMPEIPVALPDDGPAAYSYACQWWPGGGAVEGGDESALSAARWGDPWVTSGSNGRLGFVGYTRDAFGSPLGGCTVRCFRTSTNELVSQVTSDTNGQYIATTPYGDAHYLTVHNSTVTPAVAGASVDSLLPG